MAPGAIYSPKLSLQKLNPFRTKLGATFKNCLLNRSLRITPYHVQEGRGNSYFLADGTEIYDASGGAAVSVIGKYDKRVEDVMVKIMRRGITYVPSLGFDTDLTANMAGALIASTNGAMSKCVLYCSGRARCGFLLPH
jgi:adenosylmethionine-8-amino-7-oxononanoate aminotransferase